MHPTDVALEPGLSLGDWLYQQLDEQVFVEQHGAMPERVRRVAERLQHDRPPHVRHEVVVPWLRSFAAFTAPGRYIYFSRRLLEICPDDETAAFVVAHEVAHHDLGHLRLFAGPFTRHAARLQAGVLLVLVFRSLQKRVYSPEWELAADRRAVELCVAAGYDGSRCLRLFDILERIALDVGDISGVYGLDTNSDAELSPEADLLTKARVWLWQRQRGYLPIQDRRAEARRHLERLLAGLVPPTHVEFAGGA